MSIVNIIDRVCAWADTAICENIRLKAAPADSAAVDGGYDYQLVKPAVFPLFVPTSDRLPPKVLSQFPSLCVRVTEGTDDMTAKSGGVTIQLGLSAWNPGTHAKDLYTCNAEGETLVFTPYKTPQGDGYFVQDAEGWRDAWNFLDVARRAVEGAASIDGLQIDRAAGVRFGPYKEQEAIPDFYPLWFAWLEFTIRYPIVYDMPQYSEFL